ncbi:MAG: tetratricopeptide repeat protein [Bacteroides sp.]|nr:tetratricopeptide repeat protein [Ruminococcus flavefaciens]MCM1554720.1 tetratricopeptide repeat protein [Bacteroides sp.]
MNKRAGNRFGRSLMGCAFVCLSFVGLCSSASAAEFSAGYTRLPSDSLVAFVQKNYFSRGRQAKEMIRELYSRASKGGDRHLLAQCIYWDVLAEYSQSNGHSRYASGIDSLLQDPAMMRDAANRLLLNYAKAITELSSGNFTVAFRYALEAHRLAEEIGDSQMFAETAVTLGNISPYFYDYDQSRRYYDIAFNLLDTNSLAWYRLQINYSRLLFIEEKYDAAAAFIRSPMAALQGKEGHKDLLAVAWLNLGSYQAALDRRDSAYFCYNESLKLLSEDGNNNIRVLLYENIGNYFRYRKEYAQARSYYDKACSISLMDSNLSSYASLAYEISVLFSEQGMPDSSYHYLMKYNQLIYRVQ